MQTCIIFVSTFFLRLLEEIVKKEAEDYEAEVAENATSIDQKQHLF